MGQPGFVRHLAKTRRTGLGADSETDVLRLRVGRADRRRRRVEDRRHRIVRDVVRKVVESERLDQQDRAARVEVLLGVAEDPDGIAHVVQAVEEADQVEASVVALGIRLLERRPVRDACLGCAFRRGGDGRCVEVEARDGRLRVEVGQHDDSRTVTAPDVGDAAARMEHVRDAVQRVDPDRQALAIARAEEPLGAVEQVIVVIGPAQRTVAAERLSGLLGIDEQRVEHAEAACGERRRVLVGHRQGHLGRQLIGVGRSVVCQHTAGRLGIEPLANEPRVAVRPLGELVGSGRPIAAESLEKAESVAEPDAQTYRGAGHVAGELAHERFKLGFVNRGGHGTFLSVALVRSPRGPHRRYRRFAAPIAVASDGTR